MADRVVQHGVAGSGTFQRDLGGGAYADAVMPAVPGSEDVFFDALAWRPAADATLDSAASDPIDGHNGLVLVVNNTLNQQVTYNVMYSRDGGTTWWFYGATQTLTASSGVTASTSVGMSTQPKVGLFKIHLIAGATPPTTGALTMTLQRAGVL
jgi:hypothetical protein